MIYQIGASSFIVTMHHLGHHTHVHDDYRLRLGMHIAQTWHNNGYESSLPGNAHNQGII